MISLHFFEFLFFKSSLPGFHELVFDGILFYDFFKVVFAEVVDNFSLEAGSAGKDYLLLLFVPCKRTYELLKSETYILFLVILN